MGRTGRRTIKHLVCCVLLLAGAWGCGRFPDDPLNTLATVTNGTLQVGYSVNPPWVVPGPDGPTGIEPTLIRAFAKRLNANINWRQDTEQNLLEDLEKHKLHLVLAGLTDDSPWKSKIAFTRPYLERGKKKHVLAVVMGENAFVTTLEKFLHQQEDVIQRTHGHASN